MTRRLRGFLRLVVALPVVLAFCMSGRSSARDVDPLQVPDTQLEPVAWSELEGWAGDDHVVAFKAFRTGCKPLLSRRTASDRRPIYLALRDVCRLALTAEPESDAMAARLFFEDNFQPVRIAKLGERTGLLTGYYEPIVDGSRFPSPEFSAPLYRRPHDLLVDGKTAIKGVLPNRASVGRLNAKRKLVPYFDRAAIENGALDGQHLEICWIRDPWEAMNIQIQGSARVRLEDGTTVRLNYDAHNGYAFTAVGRALIERKFLARDDKPMGRISEWMARHPDQGKQARGINKAFVFFRITGLDAETEPPGAQGVPLTPGRSIAVDRIHVLGTPFFIQAELPIDDPQAPTPFRRLMVAQDTGSAIAGPARADVYFGAGPRAGRIAGRIRQQGRFVMLLPRALDMVEAGRAMPLPPPRPIIESVKQAGHPAVQPKTERKHRRPVRQRVIRPKRLR
jgi:membrane-bound lytic murein transglycosylase A